jgi:polysaccharide chain length determinant protein (PEP-CTERM system associated)
MARSHAVQPPRTSIDTALHARLQQVQALLRSIWKRRRLAASVAWAVAIVSAAVATVAPERYEASAKVYVDTQTVLKPLMAGIAYQPDIDQQVRMLAKTLISRPNIERLIDKPELGLMHNVHSAAQRELLISSLLEKIQVSSTGSGNLYSVSYRDTHPERARRLVEAIVALFVNSGAGDKRRDSEDASRFINEQIKVYEAKLVEAEDRLKDFKVRNFGVTGVSNQDYFTRISVLSDEVAKLHSDLAAAEQARDAYKRELAGEEPQLPVDATGAPGLNSPTADIDARLEAQRKQLDELLRKYTESHPDVISARRVIAQLEAQRKQELEQHARGDDHKLAATSPVYQKIRVALAETEAQVASLRARLATEQSELDQVRAQAGRVPQVEAEFAQLNRDYDILRKNYDALVARRESASLGVKLDEQSQLAEFRVVEPARVGPQPIFPGRMAMAVMAVLLSFVCGLAAPVIADLLQPTFEDSKSLREMTGRVVLGTVSLVQASRPPDPLWGTPRARYVALALMLLVTQVVWLYWLHGRALKEIGAL